MLGKIRNFPNKSRKILVYFVGGITFAEISALRFLNNDPKFPFHFVIATTEVISARTSCLQMRGGKVAELDEAQILFK